MKPILFISVGKKRDIVQARARTRQLCRLLGFEAVEQARIACLVFEAACAELCRGTTVNLVFRVQNHQFSVSCNSSILARQRAKIGEAAVRLVLSVPLPPATLATEDIGWIMQQTQRLSTPNLFDEIRQQNRDLLAALVAQQGAVFPAAGSARRLGAA